MPYTASSNRYDSMQYRRSGRSGLQLPAISLGLWHNFGGDRLLETSRAILRRALLFDLGVTHFDLANNYMARRIGSAEEIARPDLRRRLPPLPRRARHLDEGRLRHVARPVRRVGLPQVRARPQPRPVAPAHGARATSTSSIRTALRPRRRRSRRRWARSIVRSVRSGKALYGAGSRRTSPEKTREAYELLRAMGTPLLIHQPSYSLLNRWIEEGLIETLGELGVGCICFSPLAQGMLFTDRTSTPGRRHPGERAWRRTASPARPTCSAGQARRRRSAA